MNPPTVQQARKICEALEARGVIVLAFTHGDVSGASYGETRRECQQIGKTLDYIVDEILNGSIPTWDDEK